MSERLQRLLAIENHTVTTLRELRDAYFAEGNEISDKLGSFVSLNTDTPVVVSTAKPKTGKPIGTPEQRSQILELIKTKGRQSAKEIAIAISIGQPLASSIMSSLYDFKQVERVRNPNTVYREYLYELPQSAILVA